MSIINGHAVIAVSKTFYFEITLDLQESCKDNTDGS